MSPAISPRKTTITPTYSIPVADWVLGISSICQVSSVTMAGARIPASHCMENIAHSNPESGNSALVHALAATTAARTMTAAGKTYKQGDFITIDGSTGQVLAGQVDMIEPALSGEFGVLMGWADSVRKLGVRANADTPADARAAVKFGAEGIGLCRTEHMFFDEDRIQAVREMILSDDAIVELFLEPSGERASDVRIEGDPG